ncbi:MAG: DegV family protein [Nitrospinota bacterium]
MTPGSKEQRVKLITDAISDIPQELLCESGIEVVPLKVNFRERELAFPDRREGEAYEKALDDYYDLLARAEELPSTAQPSVETFREAYSRALESCDRVVSIHASEAISGTVNSARRAAEDFAGRVVVVDSRQMSVALALITLEAARDCSAGLGASDVICRLEERAKKVRAYLTLDNLRYLMKGGRIGRARYALGVLLGRKPICTIRDGSVDGVAKVKGGEAQHEAILGLAAQEARRPLLAMTAFSGRATEANALMLGEELKRRFEVAELHHARIGQIVGTHLGPSAWGLSFLPLKD